MRHFYKPQSSSSDASSNNHIEGSHPTAQVQDGVAAESNKQGLSGKAFG